MDEALETITNGNLFADVIIRAPLVESFLTKLLRNFEVDWMWHCSILHCALFHFAIVHCSIVHCREPFRQQLMVGHSAMHGTTICHLIFIIVFSCEAEIIWIVAVQMDWNLSLFWSKEKDGSSGLCATGKVGTKDKSVQKAGGDRKLPCWLIERDRSESSSPLHLGGIITTKRE